MRTQSIRDKIKALANESAPSMVPQPREEVVPEKKGRKKTPPPPDLSRFVSNLKVRLEIARKVERLGELSQQIAPLAKEKKDLTEDAKVLVSANKLDKCSTGDWRFSYYNTPRTKWKDDDLYALFTRYKVPTSEIQACRQTFDSWGLRVSPLHGEDTPEEV